jgi:hypothetical protein
MMCSIYTKLTTVVELSGLTGFYTYSLEGGLRVGYASKKIILGTEFTFNVNTYHEDDVNAIVNDKVYGFIYFRYRFDTPDFIARTYDRFAKK